MFLANLHTAIAQFDDWQHPARIVEFAGDAPVIGTKKLRSIREDLHRALAGTGRDPIRWLDERLATGQQTRTAAATQSEVLQSLRRFLRRSGTSRPHTPQSQRAKAS
jgi:hypothetical protein